MSSVFSASRNAETETGAGGKIVRRRPTASHPYRRPESPPRSESPRWISGLLAPARTIAAGAGKLLSFAFQSLPNESDSSGSSSDSDEDEDDDYSEDDSIDVEKLSQLQNEITPLATEGQHLNRQSSEQKSESKRMIERLLLQETFTRVECTELMKIIQSRVVDGSTMKEGEDATQKELYGRPFGNDVTFSGAWRSSLQLGRSPEAYPYSINAFSTLSPGSSALRDHTPNLCDTAIMEAKKWLEEKKLEPCSNSERDHGNCSLSTGVLPQVTEGDIASPVDMAKSYMRLRPPWSSPSWNNTELKTPPQIGILNYSDESSHPMAHCSSPLTKDLKRNSLSIGPWGTIEETRRVRLKSSDDIVDHHAHEQIDSSATIFNNKPTQTLPVPDKEEVLGTHESSFLPAANILDASPKLPAESAVDKSCQNGILHPSGENAVEVDLSVANHAVDVTNNLMPSETEHSGPEKGISASDPLIIISEKSEGLEEAQTTKELLVNSDKASHECPVPDSTPVQCDSARVVLNSELEAAVSERDGAVIPCDADGFANHNSTCASSLQSSYQAGNTVQTEKTLQLHEAPDLEEEYSFLGSISQGRDKNKKDANGVGNGDDVNDSLFSGTSLSDAYAEPRLKPPDETTQNSTSSDHGEVAVHKPGESCEILSEASIEVPAIDETNTFLEELQNGISKPMNEAPQIQPQKKSSAARGGTRGRKPGYSRRGRGRGK